MTQQFLGQIQPFGFGFAPKGWALCNGQILSIVQNTALFALLGTTYGGNGQTTFGLPNLQSRVPMHAGTYLGNVYPQGEEAGEEQVTLNINTLPFHTHAFVGSTLNADAVAPAAGQGLGKVNAPSGMPSFFYGPDAVPQPLNMGAILPDGGNLPHNNLQPYLTINWCIALTGIFPARN